MATPATNPKARLMSKAEKYGARTVLTLLILSCWLWPKLTAPASFWYYDQQMRWRAEGKEALAKIAVIKLKNSNDEGWAETYAQLILAIAKGKPKKIGLDFIPQMLQVWPGSWSTISQKGYKSMLVIGCRVSAFSQDAPELPADKLYSLFSQQLGYLNLPTDSDGIVRNYHLGELALGGKFTGSAPSFASKLIDQNQPLIKSRLIYIDFSQTSKEFAADEIFEHQDDSSWLEEHFKDRYVLIGSGAPGDQDLHQTAVGKNTYGVEIHAQALQTLLTARELKKASTVQQLGLLVLLILPSLLLARTQLTYRYLLAGLLAAALWSSSSSVFFLQQGLYFPAGPPLASIAILAGGLQGIWVLIMERNREILRATFTRYVSKDVVSELLKQPQAPDPKPSEITVMFADINGFSTACEKYDVVTITHMLNAYFNEMSVIIERNGGTIMRFIGDEFLILFGAPHPIDNPELAAVKTALAMHKCLDELKAQSLGKNQGFFDIKVGIHSGEMVLTSIGTRGRSDYNVIGDSANIASRIQSLCKTYDKRLLVSETIWNRIPRQEFRGESLGECSVKGRNTKVKVYNIYPKS